MMQRLRNLLLITTALMPVAPHSQARSAGSVVGGNAQINNPGTSNVIVNQTTDHAIISWRTFGISAGETTAFNQNNSNSVVLNRVVGGMGPSEIFGKLDANGKVFMVNRDGISSAPARS